MKEQLDGLVSAVNKFKKSAFTWRNRYKTLRDYVTANDPALMDGFDERK